GYNVDVKQVEAGPMWAATADDEDTLNATGWLPATHGDYQEQYEDDVEIYEESNLIDKAPLALTVPEYMEDVNSIEDLKGNEEDRKSTRLNSSHVSISYAVFCL